MSTKNGLVFLRSATTPDARDVTPQAWETSIEQSAKSRIDQALKPADEVSEVDREIIDHFEQLSDAHNVKYWHCRVRKCDKTFKGEHFMWTHFKTRHSDELVKQRKKFCEAIMRQRYKADKNRLIGPVSAKEKVDSRDKSHRDNHRSHRNDGPHKSEASKPYAPRGDDKGGAPAAKSKGLLNYDTIAF